MNSEFGSRSNYLHHLIIIRRSYISRFHHKMLHVLVTIVTGQQITSSQPSSSGPSGTTPTDWAPSVNCCFAKIYSLIARNEAPQSQKTPARKFLGPGAGPRLTPGTFLETSSCPSWCQYTQCIAVLGNEHRPLLCFMGF